jgi:branched-subunit amino acid transport protein AzlD
MGDFMIVPPLVALFAWVPISLLIFRRFPVRKAILFTFVGGWAILPAANYVSKGDAFPYWILGTSLESDYFITKATIIGLTGILGVYLFDRKAFKRFKLTVWDLAMGMWLIAPLLSAIANPESFLEGCTGEVYQLLAWGSPYLIGRLYFTDTHSLRLAAKAFVIGGLSYIPFCIFENIKGPQIYARLYGYQPFQMNGAQRFFGYRPIGLLENGNQLGIWMATATLIAIWLWRRKTDKAILGIPIFLVALALFAVTILCQSTGAILLMLALIPFVFVDPRHLSRTVSIVLVVGILAFAGFRLANVVSFHDLVEQNRAAHAVDSYLKSIGKGSLGWRLNEDERHMTTALEEPILGYGQWNWWIDGVERPWSLWLLVFGMYGSVGLVSLEALLLIPALRAVWFPLTRSDIGYTNMRHTLSAAVLISAIDSLLNSAIILPLLLVIGGMTIWNTTDTEVDTEFDKSRAAAGTPGWRGSQNARRKTAKVVN